MSSPPGPSAGTGASQDKHHYLPVEGGVTKSSVARSGKVLITLNEEQIALIHARGQVHAIQEKCPHQGGPLHSGEIEDVPNKALCIKCPWHFYEFNIITGDNVVPGNQPDKKLKVYPVRVEGEKISVGFQKIPKKVFFSEDKK